MSPDTEEVVVEEGEPVEPIGHVRVVYLGPCLLYTSRCV